MKLWIFGGSAALLLALAIGAALNPVKALGLARAVGGFVLEKLRAGVEWARKPDRDWWRIGCVAFGLLFATASLYADNRRREVLYVTERCQTVTTTLKTELVTVRATADLDRVDLSTCRAQLEKVVGIEQDVKAENAAALLELEREARAADARAREWRARYDAKTPTCSAALAALEGPCASLSDY